MESEIDSQYFGVSSAKVLLKHACPDEQKQDELLEFLRGFAFCMIANKTSDPVNNRWIGEKTSAFLVDINIQLRKELSTAQPIQDRAANGHRTTIADRQPENKQVIQIAETYFKLSQFLNDPYLPRDKASRIYGDIVKNAFGKPGRFFVITTIEDVVAGFLLFSIHPADSTSTIQLIAVNQNFNRQGIGQAMVQSMENHVLRQNISTIFVGTQFNNFSALKFYNANGFAYAECSSIYHYWPLRR